MIIKKLSDIKCGTTVTAETEATIAVGNFDGMHRGHVTLIDAMLREARRANAQSVVFTFENYTKTETPHLISPRERNRLLSDLGVDVLILGDFNALRDLSPEEFTKSVLIGKCRCKTVFCGYNFRFGRGASGDAETLRSLMRSQGGDAVILPPVTAEGKPVSSTLLRQYITEGDVAAANRLLPEPFSVTAKIEKGKQLGRRLGMPTVNQYMPAHRVIPRFGVYAAAVTLEGKTYPAVTNVGVRPTVNDGDFITLESYLFGFSEDAYGKTATTALLQFLRPEMKFSSVEELRLQVEKDKKAALEYLSADYPAGEGKGEEHL